MTKSRGILGPRQYWTDAEDAVLRAHYATTLTADLAELLGHTLSSTHQRAKRLGLSKSREWIAATARERIESNPDHGSRRTRLQAGHTPPNKGIKRPPGWSPGRMAEGQFKPGRPAHEARNYQPIGTHRINRDGHVERKVTDDPAIVPARRWVPVYRIVWQEANGPIPKDHLVRFKPGMATVVPEDITVDRLECISKAENARQNSIHNMPPELAAIARLRGQITRAIHEREEQEQ